MKNVLVVLILIACPVLAQSPRDTLVKDRTPKTKLDFEAHRVAKKAWDSVLTWCGESYFTVNTAQSAGPIIYEIRGVTFKMQWGAVSEPSRLNGLEWSGMSYISAKATREHRGGWSRWDRQPFAVYLEKNNGNWRTKWQYWMRLEKIECADIPGIQTVPQKTSIRSDEIRRYDFFDTIFDLGDGSCAKLLGKRVIKLKGDEYKDPRNPDLVFGLVKQYIYGDLTRDGVEEAVVITNCGGMHPIEQAYIFTMKNGRPIQLAKLEEGDRASGGIVDPYLCQECENGIRIQDGQITVTRMWGDAPCCPRYIESTPYSWNGNRLAISGAISRKNFVPKNK